MEFFFGNYIWKYKCNLLSELFSADLLYKQIKYTGTSYFGHMQVNYTRNLRPIFFMLNFMSSMPINLYFGFFSG